MCVCVFIFFPLNHNLKGGEKAEACEIRKPKQFQRITSASIIYFGLVFGKYGYLKNHQVCDIPSNSGTGRKGKVGTEQCEVALNSQEHLVQPHKIFLRSLSPVTSHWLVLSPKKTTMAVSRIQDCFTGTTHSINYKILCLTS